MRLQTALSRAHISIPVLMVFVIGMVVRLLLLPLTNVDSWGWYKTGENIVSGDGFYDRSGYIYGPAFGYLVTISLMVAVHIFDVGTFSTQNDAMIGLQPYFDFTPALQTPEFLVAFKIMMVAGDVMAAILVRWFIMYLTEDRRKADIGFILMFLSPIILIESSIHGMFDIYCGTLSLLSIYFIVNKRYCLAGISWSAATLMKMFPVFLLPVFIAYIFKQKKGDLRAGMIDVLYAVGGALFSLILLYFPQILNGTFDKTWEFMLGRASLANGTLGSLVDHAWLIILAAVVLIPLIYRFRGSVEKLAAIKLTARRSILAMAAAILVVFCGLIAINGGVTEFFSNLFHSSYIVGIAMQFFAFIVSIFLAKKLYDLKLEDQTKLLLMVGMFAIATGFLWVPMPEYLILLLPLICVYAMVYDRRYLTPFFLISFGAAFFIIMVEGPAALFVSVAGYTDIMNIDTVISLTKAYVSGIMIGDYSIWQLLFCIIGAAVQLIGVILLFVYRFRPYRLRAYRI